MNKHIIDTLVENKPGVLQKVAGLFNRRAFNIDGITVGESEIEGVARMVITVSNEKNLEQVIKQLDKLVEVVKIQDISDNSVKRELCLIKIINPDFETRSMIMQYVSIFKAKIINVKDSNIIIEITGSPSKIDAFISLFDSYKINVARTGLTAMNRS